VSDPVPSYRKKPPKLVGGLLCLDFVNTVSWRGDPEDRGERLTSYTELLHWASHAGILASALSQRLAREAERRPEAARAVVAGAIEFREALVKLALDGKRRSAASIGIVNALLAAAPPRSAIQALGSEYVWAGSSSRIELDAPIHPVIWSAADLLTSGQWSQVRQCSDTRCAWVFLDRSPTGRRRWCSMKECGNRAKVRRHHEAGKKSAKSPSG
jgi:predicted RNA-binding Zn ribbon-like protein